MNFFRTALSKKIAVLMALWILLTQINPVLLYASSNGPIQTEFSNFTSSSATQMVNEFTGDFSYALPLITVPGPNGSSYPLILGYNSEISPSQESSWVGLGWTLNAGSVIRNKRGFPDDFKGDTITYWNQVPPNWSATVGAAGAFEVTSVDLLSVSTGLNASLRYNNYNGFSYVAGLKLNALGLANLGIGVSNGEFIGPDVRPQKILSDALMGGMGLLSESLHMAYNRRHSRFSEENSRIAGLRAKSLGSVLGFDNLPLTGSITYPSTNTIHTFGSSVDMNVSVQGDPFPFPLGIGGEFYGNFNIQSTFDKDEEKVFGYMYSGHAGVSDLMDYYSEMDAPYDKKEEFMSIPFNNADNFTALAEGMGGTFRLYNQKVGVFKPNARANGNIFYKAGADVGLGLNMDFGARVTIGGQATLIGGWGDSEHKFAVKSDSITEPYFFKFYNDLGDNWNHNAPDGITKAKLEIDNLFPSGEIGDMLNQITNVTKIDYAEIPTEYNESQRHKRNTLVSYNTNEEMKKVVSGQNIYAHNKRSDIESLTNRSKKDGIGEFAITNNEGKKYIYGLPVYVKNERTLRYGTENVPTSNIINNTVVRKSITGDQRVKVGEEMNTTYAGLYLLTEVNTPDYIDRTLNGPTDDDLGGYVKFSYDKLYGYNTSQGWYNWRSPYNGMYFNGGNLSEPEDDQAMSSSGLKEIYYLNTIETKTHIAIFYTSDRKDGLESAPDELAANSFTIRGTKKLKKLDKIELFVKDDTGAPGKLIKTVHFSYNYELCNATLNSLNGGKLTLKAVWFEHDGVSEQHISPYTFGYEYKNFGYPQKYNHIDNYADIDRDGTPDLIQNPNYSRTCTDAWGNYQLNGPDRAEANINWLNQNPDTMRFDPAAWSLKQIGLPSGGEIHIQYEQDDYAYVQDKKAMNMISILSNSNDEGPNAASTEKNKYYLNLSDLGISPSHPHYQIMLNKVKKEIQKELIDKKQKIYFRFLYSLKNNGLTAGACNSENISGFVNVKSTGIDTGGLYVTLGDEDDQFSTPRIVCLNYVKYYKMGRMLTDDCERVTNGLQADEDAAEGNVNALLGSLSNVASLFQNLNQNHCLEVDYANSYLRIPILDKKLGGGIRVKRILSFDKGLEQGDESLYGTEYFYTTDETNLHTGVSSGVATNEPGSITEENPLLHFKSARKELESKAISGSDIDQTSPIMGQSLLPGPSVGYSKVIVKSIHEGKTSVGFGISEFNTCKDFPSFKMLHSPIEENGRMIPMPFVFYNAFIAELWQTQGYLFKMNNMHGTIKSVSTWGGDIYNSNTWTKSSKQVYTYFAEDESIPTINDFKTSVKKSRVGYESEINIESCSTQDISADLAVEVDASVGYVPPFMIPVVYSSAVPYMNVSFAGLYSNATSKVETHPIMLKKVESTQGGISHHAENIAYNEQTGEILWTRTSDGFDGLNLPESTDHDGTYNTFAFHAPDYYSSLGKKSVAENLIIKSAFTKLFEGGNHYLKLQNSDLCKELKLMAPGDLIIVKNSGIVLGVFHVGDIKGIKIPLYPASQFSTPSTTSSVAVVDIEIVRSAKTNQLITGIGSVTTYGNPNIRYIKPDSAAVAERVKLAIKLNSALPNGTVHLKGNPVPSDNFSVGDEDAKCILTVGLTDLGDELEISINNVNNKSSVCRIDKNESGAGYFGLHPDTYEIVYFADNATCFPIDVPCLRLCSILPTVEIEGVLAANANTLTDVWANNVTGNNVYETGERGKWRFESGYLFKSDLTNAAIDSSGERIYKDAGVYTDFDFFNWKVKGANDKNKWLKNNTYTKYNENGSLIQEKTFAGVVSSSRIESPYELPIIIGENASEKSISFESFELNGNTNVTAHSGKKSAKINSNSTMSVVLSDLEITKENYQSGVISKLWMKTQNILPLNTPLLMSFNFTSNTISKPCKPVLTVGEWTLVEVVIPADEIQSFSTIGNKFTVGITNPANIDCYIDDVKIQPIESNTKCMVIDYEALRIIASFNDMHLATFYQFNAKGDQIREIAETEQGLKTIKEGQYNTRKVSKSNLLNSIEP